MSDRFDAFNVCDSKGNPLIDGCLKNADEAFRFAVKTVLRTWTDFEVATIVGGKLPVVRPMNPQVDTAILCVERFGTAGSQIVRVYSPEFPWMARMIDGGRMPLGK